MAGLKVANSKVFNSNDTLLVTLSVLPDRKGKIDWQPINLDTISTEHSQSLADIVRDGVRYLPVIGYALLKWCLS